MREYGKTTEDKHIGFIRSVAFSKVIGLFEPERLVSVQLERKRQRSSERIEYGGFISKVRSTSEAFVANWERSRAKAPYRVFPVNKTREAIMAESLGDWEVKRIVYEFKSPKVVKVLNEMLADIAEEKKREAAVLGLNISLYATFQHAYNADFKKLDYLRELNKQEIEEYQFKHSVLDFAKLYTERAVKYGEQESIPVIDDVRFSRAVLGDRVLDWGGWPAGERTFGNHLVAPTSIRQMVLGGDRKWTIAREVEVNG